MAGSQPVAGANLQMYTTGTTGNGSLPSARLATAAVTDASGSFSVPAGSYSCPAGASVLYMIASGGQIAGQVGSGSGSDSALALMTVPGACQAILPGAGYVLNELTTVASAYALRPFMASGAGAAEVQVGASATNLAGPTMAAATLASLVDLSTGTAPGPGFPATGAAPSPRLNSLANALDSCLVSGGAGSPACSSLFQAAIYGTSQPLDTLQAAFSIANHPGNNVGALYTLSTRVAAFAPALPAAPADWTLPIAFSGGGVNQPTALALDSLGRVWMANYPGTVSLFSNTGVPLLPQGISGYGLNQSVGGAVDGQDRFWVTNEASDASINGGDGSVTVLSSSGGAVTSASMYTAGGLYEPLRIAFDPRSTAWILDYYDNAVTVLNTAGVPQSGAKGYQSPQFVFATGVAVDAEGNGWVANSDDYTITRVAADGSAFTSFEVGGGPSAVAIDAAGNVWSANYFGDSVGLVSGGQVVSGGGYGGGGLVHPVSLAADGNGTVWVANFRAPGLSEIAGVGSAQPGAALSPSAGWGPDMGMLQAQSVAIDAAGNVWVASNGDNRLVEFVGLAAPVKTPLLGATRVP